MKIDIVCLYETQIFHNLSLQARVYITVQKPYFFPVPLKMIFSPFPGYSKMYSSLALYIFFLPFCIHDTLSTSIYLYPWSFLRIPSHFPLFSLPPFHIFPTNDIGQKGPPLGRGRIFQYIPPRLQNLVISPLVRFFFLHLIFLTTCIFLYFIILSIFLRNFPPSPFTFFVLFFPPFLYNFFSFFLFPDETFTA